MASEKNIRVLHVTESHAKSDGGVTTVLNDLTKNVSILGGYSCVMAATDKREFTPHGVDFIGIDASYNSLHSLFSSKLKKIFYTIIKEKRINVIHIHGIWLPLQIIAGRVAKEMGIPFIMTSHGMLESWLWTGKGWKNFIMKKLYFYIIAYPVYKYADTIHAITSSEHDSLKVFFPYNKYVVLSNAIELYDNKQNMIHERIIFFIGRINPIKGVHLLLDAFKKAKLSTDWKLVIAGPVEVPAYMEELQKSVRVNNLESQVKFIGPVYAGKKEKCYQNAWVTVVPSYSEVVGMVNLEAGMFYCPTITTINTGLLDWGDGGGILIQPIVNELTMALKQVVSWSEIQRHERGAASYALVKNKYSWNIIGKEWIDLYADLVK